MKLTQNICFVHTCHRGPGNTPAAEASTVRKPRLESGLEPIKLETRKGAAFSISKKIPDFALRQKKIPPKLTTRRSREEEGFYM